MSSLKKYLKRRTYKERGQPESRGHLGILEKHKDYVERAKHHKRQKRVVQKLQQKVEEKNPDEFNFAMEYQRTKDGIPMQREEDLTQEEEMLLKTQDLNYISSKLQQEKKKIDKLQAELHFIGAPTKNEHILFVDGRSDAKQLSPSDYFDTPEELLDRSFNRPKNDLLKQRSVVAAEENQEETMDRLEKERAKKYKILSQRLHRYATLQNVHKRLILKKELAKGKDYEKTDKEDGQVVYKWRMQRKK